MYLFDGVMKDAELGCFFYCMTVLVLRNGLFLYWHDTSYFPLGSILADYKLHGWTNCWARIIWCSISGMIMLSLCWPLHACELSFLTPFPCLPSKSNLLWIHMLFSCTNQAKCLETGETVAIKKVLQDKRYKNRELQTMRLLDHPNVVSLKHCFFSTTDKDELYLNLVLEYVPETVHRVLKHYNKLSQRMPLILVKLYTYQVLWLYLLHLLYMFCLSIPSSVFISSPDFLHSEVFITS